MFRISSRLSSYFSHGYFGNSRSNHSSVYVYGSGSSSNVGRVALTGEQLRERTGNTYSLSNLQNTNTIAYQEAQRLALLNDYSGDSSNL